MHFFEDDRVQSIHDLFTIPNYQINITHARSTENCVAWHLHKKQTDKLFCIKGSFKIGLGFPDKERHNNVRVDWKYLSDKNNTILTIHPNIWHGYRALEPNSILIYGLDKKYDSADILKANIGDFGENWRTPHK